MIKRRLHVAKPVPLIPTASMADIAFLLIIFFMLTTTFSPERTQVTLPDSVKRDEVSREPAIVAITPDGQVVFTDGELASALVRDMQDLGVQVQSVVDAFPDREFVIKADHRVRYEHVDQVLEALRGAGARRIGLLTNQEIVRSN